MKTGIRILFYVLVAATGSCVFPTHLADERPYESQAIGFIVPGESTRTDVLKGLGNAERVFSNGQWWTFQADRRMTEWVWIIAAPTGIDGVTLGGDVRIYNLIVEFDDEDTVRRKTVVTDQRPCTDDETLCYADGRLTVVHESAIATRSYSDESSHAGLTDLQLQALRSEESARMWATLDNGEQVELIEHGGLTFEAKSMRPFTGRVSMFDDAGIKRVEASYDGGELDGMLFLWVDDGSSMTEVCFENGEPVLSTENNCVR